MSGSHSSHLDKSPIFRCLVCKMYVHKIYTYVHSVYTNAYVVKNTSMLLTCPFPFCWIGPWWSLVNQLTDPASGRWRPQRMRTLLPAWDTTVFWREWAWDPEQVLNGFYPQTARSWSRTLWSSTRLLCSSGPCGYVGGVLYGHFSGLHHLVHCFLPSVFLTSCANFDSLTVRSKFSLSMCGR